MTDDPIRLLAFDHSLVSPEMVEVLLDDPMDARIFDEIARANKHRPEIMHLLVGHPDTPEEVRRFAADILALPVVPRPEASKIERPQVKAESLLQKIQRLNVSARVQLALKGGREIRGILARDPNKEVVLSVLENGKVSESEVEMMAKSRQAFEDALRKISKNREWMKKYAIVSALVTNPKTPAGIAVTHVSGLKTKDLTILEKNRNVSEAVRIAAKKLLTVRKPH